MHALFYDHHIYLAKKAYSPQTNDGNHGSDVAQYATQLITSIPCN